MKTEESDIYKAGVKKIIGQIYRMGGDSVEENGFITYKLNETEKFLNWLILNGYLLHGSTRKIEEDLKPYQANDKVKESGNRKAIYVTKVPMVAMFCALTGGVTGLSRRHSSHITIEKGVIDYGEMYFGVSDMRKIANIGYIYVLSKDQVDEEINGEYLSYREIPPLAVIEINKKDFPYKFDIFKTL